MSYCDVIVLVCFSSFVTVPPISLVIHLQFDHRTTARLEYVVLCNTGVMTCLMIM